MSKPKQSMEKRLLRAQVIIDGILGNPEIMALLEPWGYTEAKLQALRALYQEALDLVAKQKAEYGEQYEATAEVQAVWDTADKAYIRTLKIARIALRGDGAAATALMLTGRRDRTLSGWLHQTTIFYQNLLARPDWIAAVGEFGYDQARLEAEAALVQTVAETNVVQEREKGEAQEATKLRDDKMNELDQKIADLQVVVEMALEEHPQWLEQLGFGPVP